MTTRQYIYGAVGVALLISIIIGISTCNKNNKNSEDEVSLFSKNKKAENPYKKLKDASNEVYNIEKDRDVAFDAVESMNNYRNEKEGRTSSGFDAGNKNSQNQNQPAVNPACPTCPQKEDKDGRQVMKDAETEAREYAENEDRVNRMNNKNVQTQKNTTSSSSSSARASRSYRPAPAPKPQIIIIKEEGEFRQSVRESISTDMQKKSTSDCVGCDNAVPYSDEIRQRQLESKKNGYKKDDPLCILLPADPKFPNKPRGTIRFKNEKEKEEFLKNSGGLFREE